MGRIELTSNTIEGRAEMVVNTHLCVVDFKQPKGKEPCQFDWIELDANGNVNKHHDINVRECTHVLVGQQYERATSDNINKVLGKEFPIYKIADNGNKLYTAKSWMAVRKVQVGNVNVKLEMEIRSFRKLSKDNFAYISVQLPAGITMTFDNPNEEDECHNLTGLKLSKEKYNVTLSVSSNASEESEIIVKNAGEGIKAGSLGIFAFEELVYHVVVLPLLDSSRDNILNAASTICKQVNIATLNEKVGKYFTHLGIRLDFVLSDTKTMSMITYNSKITLYKECIDEQGRITPDGSKATPKTVKDFFMAIIDNKENQHVLTSLGHEHKGSQLLLTDRESTDKKQEQPNTISNVESTTHTTEGYAILDGTVCTLYKGQYNDYITCAHELGHNLGCYHIFAESSLFEKTIYSEQYIHQIKQEHILGEISNPDEREKFENYLNHEHQMSLDTSHNEFTAYYHQETEVQYRIASTYYDRENIKNEDIQEREGRLKGAEQVIYTQFQTKNIMDYSNNKVYFFKWQWVMMRAMAKKHIK